MKNVIFLLGILVCTTQVMAQAVVKQVDDLLTSPSFAEEDKPIKGIYSIDSQLGLTADQFIFGKKRELCTDPQADLIKIGSQQSKAGREYHRYVQTWGGIPIEGQYLLAQESNGTLKAVNGALVTGLSIITSPALTEQVALGLVLQTPAKQYAWENAVMEADLQATKNDPTATWLPEGKLVIVPSDHAPTATLQDFRLAWRFDIYSLEPHAHDAVYVDAQTGALIKKRSLMRHSYVNGTGVSNYNGTQNITCEKHSYHYRLKNEVIETKKYTGWFYGYGRTINNFTPNWTNKKDAIDVHWGVEQFVDYLDITLGRNGYNDNGGRLTAMTNLNQNNAFWDGTRMWFGKGDNTDRSSLTSLDIVAHEYTHAMLDQIIPGGFTYAGESGAIEESYCDIFGELLELHVKGNADWKVGGEITMTAGSPNGEGLRNLNTPRKYMDNLWHDGPSDNWGVHANSALHNYWFYLIANGNSNTVNGIGIPAATELLYETLLMLQPYSDYMDLRNSSIFTSNNLPSFTHAMRDDVIAAWNEVGLSIPTGDVINNVQPSNQATFYGGFVDTISWDTNLSIASVDLAYSINGGVSWTTINTAIDYTPGFYVWNIPQHFSNTALVKVVDANNAMSRGLSDSYFNLINTTNIAPVASDDILYTTQGFFESINSWVNDFDEKGIDPSSITILTNILPDEGTLSVQVNNNIRINVNPDFIGTFNFDYQICDYGTPVLCDTATIVVNAAVAPALKWAMDDWAVQNLTETMSRNLLRNDYLLDASWSFEGWDSVALTHGTITINALNGDYEYSPITFGRDTIRYFVGNGMVSDTGYLYLFNVEDRPLAKDSMDLVILYEMADNNTNWDLNTVVSDWNGVTVSNNRVVNLRLSFDKLAGKIPDFSSLDQLTDLDLGYNSMTGQIPDFSHLNQLETLKLMANRFVGQIPDFSRLPNLTYLSLLSNVLSGPIPNFSNIPQLNFMRLDDNHLSSSIPNFYAIPLVTELNLGANQLSGKIPDFINFPELIELELNHNNLTDSIPDFSNTPKMSFIDFRHNQLSYVPNFTNPTSLIRIYLEGNFIEGNIPDFAGIPLISLWIQGNYFSGAVPDFSVRVPSMVYLDILDNNLTFEGMEQNLGVAGFDYDRQAKIPLLIYEDSLTVNAGGTLAKNTYVWYAENNPILLDSIKGRATFRPNADGYYYCKVTNEALPGFVLTSNVRYYAPTCNVISQLPDSIALCPLDTLNAGFSNMQTYTWWLDGTEVGSEQKLGISLAGTYTLQMQDACANIVLDSIKVTIDPHCIYPGDTNHDGIVNHFDLLEIGLHFGANGSPRADTSTVFRPIMGNDWSDTTNEGLNFKHIDSNGDGNINALDTVAIVRNYGKTWKNSIPASNAPFSPLILIPEIYSISGLSDTIFIRYILENDSDSLLQYYGFAYTTFINAPIPYAGVTYINAPTPNEGIANFSAIDSANIEQYLIISEQLDTNQIETAITKSDLQDEMIATGTVVVGDGQITTERDLPGSDTPSVIEVSTENVQLTTINSNFTLGSFPSSVSGGTTTLYYTENLAYTLSPRPASCEEYGRISTKILHGTAPYTFLWSDGQTTGAATGLSAGTYQVSVTDSAGKILVGQSTITGVDKIEIIATITAATGTESNGAISLTPSGGLGDYTINWSDQNAQIGPLVTGLTAGTYIALIEDDACTASFEFTVENKPILNIKVLLEGAYNSDDSLMRDELRKKGLVPFLDPYLEEYSATFTAFDTDGPDAIVDWVLVKLKEGLDLPPLIEIPALLQRDGDLVGLDGRSAVTADDIPTGSYFVVIYHRNHLPIMASSPAPFTSLGLSYDFTTANSYIANFGFGQENIGSNKWAMFSGNGDQRDFLNAKDINGMDRSLWGNNNGAFNTYNQGDFNLDGDVTGLDNTLINKNYGLHSTIPE